MSCEYSYISSSALATGGGWTCERNKCHGTCDLIHAYTASGGYNGLTVATRAGPVDRTTGLHVCVELQSRGGLVSRWGMVEPRTRTPHDARTE